jgi:hypothetical protein
MPERTRTIIAMPTLMNHPLAEEAYANFIGLEMNASEERFRQQVLAWGAQMEEILKQGVGLVEAAERSKPGFESHLEEAAALNWLERFWVYNVSALKTDLARRLESTGARK